MRIPKQVAKPHAAAGNHRFLLSFGEDRASTLHRIRIRSRSAVRRSGGSCLETHRVAVDRRHVGHWSADFPESDPNQLASALVAARLVVRLWGVACVDSFRTTRIYLPNN